MTSAAADEILHEFDRAAEPRSVLVRGRAGSGKTALLNEVRERLRVDRVALRVEFVDDVHTLGPAELAALRERIDSGSSVVLATEPRPQRADLRELAAVVSARGSIVDLRPLTAAEVAATGRDMGIAVAPRTAHAIVAHTAGIRAAVVTALESLRTKPAAAEGIASSVSGWASTALQTQPPAVLAVLVLTVAGRGLDPGEVSDIAGVDAADTPDLIERVRALGVVSDQDQLLAGAVDPLRAIVGVRQFTATQRRLLEARLDAGALRPDTAALLAESGLQDPRLAEYLCTAAASADPSAAHQLYHAAIEAGADAAPLAVQRCEIAAVVGDYDTAAGLADGVLNSSTASADDLATAVRVTAYVCAQRGMSVRGAQLYSWLGPQRVGADAAIAAAVFYSVGDAESAARMLAVPSSGPPTDAFAGTVEVGKALQQSMHAGSGAVNTIGRALTILGPHSSNRLFPVQPTTIAALMLLHRGDPARAGALVERVLAADRPGTRTWTSHRLLSAWVAMLKGDDAVAGAVVDELGGAMTPRDLMFAHAIRVGLARRSGDHGKLTQAWAAAVDTLDAVTTDLFMLLPLGELWLAAVRLDDIARITHLVDEATALLAGLGDPPGWAATVHWYGVQAAIMSASPAALLPHAASLKVAADAGDTYAAALAAAGRAWLRVLQDTTDPLEVEESARTLGRIGLPWDGARLASEAALQISDTATATSLLQVARSLRQSPTRADRPAPATAPTATTPTGTLSEREQEVADLLVLGLTYREVGARLYISAKTVEHHVARIRRRLGAGSRSELLSMLRAMGHGKADGAQLV